MYRSYFFLFGSQRTYSAVKPGQCRFLLQLLSSHLRIEMRCYLAPSQRSLSATRLWGRPRDSIQPASEQTACWIFWGSVGRRRCLGEGGRQGGIPASSQLKSCGRWKRGDGREKGQLIHSLTFVCQLKRRKERKQPPPYSAALPRDRRRRRRPAAKAAGAAARFTETSMFRRI